MSNSGGSVGAFDRGNRSWHVTPFCVGCGACPEASLLLKLDIKAGVAVLERQPRDQAEEGALRLAASLCPVMAIRATV